MDLIWEEVKCQIKKKLPDHSYRIWIDPIQLIEQNENQLTLSSPNNYYTKRLKDNYLPVLNEAFSNLGYNARTLRTVSPMMLSSLKAGRRTVTS